MGYRAGFHLTTGTDNIDIGNQGVAAETNTIHIGTQGTQTAAYVAGVYNRAISGTTKAVIVNPQGRLGTANVAGGKEVAGLRERVRRQDRALARQQQEIDALKRAIAGGR